MYSSVAAVRKAVGRTRLENALPSTSGSFILERLQAATAEIDSRIIKWYDLPLVTTALTTDQLAGLNALIDSWAISIAVYQMLSMSAKDIPKGVQIAYDRTQSRLQAIDKGAYALPYVASRVRNAVIIVGDNESVLTSDLFDRSRIF
jgi:hypothetical protein